MKNIILAFLFLPQFILSQSIKLDWSQKYNQETNTAFFMKILEDEEGNVFTSGRSALGLSSSFLTLKYDSLGNSLWDAHFDHFFSDRMRDSELFQGGIIVVGTVSDALASGYSRAKMIRYDNDGAEVWNHYLYDIDNYSADVWGIEIDGENIYVFGAFMHIDSMEESAMFVKKINPETGEADWTNIYNESGSMHQRAIDGIILEDRIRALGHKQKNGQSFFALHDISFEGDSLTSTEFQLNHGLDQNNNSIFNADGNWIIVDETICKFQISGDTAWCFNFAENEQDIIGEGKSVAYDEDGNFYITGWVKDTFTNQSNTKTIALTNEGNLIWSHTDNLANSNAGLRITTSENLVFIGSSVYDSDNQLEWNIRPVAFDQENGDIVYDTIINLMVRDQIRAIAYKNGHFYLGGESYNHWTQTEDMVQTLLKFSIEEPNTTEEIWEESIEIFPNPIENILTINQKNGLLFEEYKIYDTSGKFIFSANLKHQKETIDISKLESGLYFIELHNKNQTLTKKLLKL